MRHFIKSVIDGENNMKKNSILAIQLAGLGDMVLATPALSALRKLYNKSKVCLLTNSRSADIIKGSQDVDEVFVADNFFYVLKIIKKIRAYNFDIAVNLYRLYSFKGALKMFLLFLAIGGRYWVGRDTNGRGFFYHLKIKEKLPDEKHEVEHKLDIIQALGGQIDAINLKVEYDIKDDNFVADILNKEGIGSNDILIGMNCATFKSSRNWKIAGYIQLAERLIRELSVKVAFCGRDIDRKIFNNIRENLSVEVVDLVGKLTVRQLAAFIKHCNLFISPDSGPMHLAAALNVPLVALFGQGEYSELRPFGEERIIRIIRTPIKSITVEEVLNAAKGLLIT